MINYQAIGDRLNSPFIKTILSLENKIPSFSECREIRLKLKEKTNGNLAWKKFKRKYIEYVLFKIFVKKKKQSEKFFFFFFISNNLILSELENIRDNIEFKSGLHLKDLKPSKYPQLYKFCKTTYLKEIRKRYRGVFSISSHIRIAQNDNQENFWDERYSKNKSNFHFDEQFNSFTMIIYLSTVTENDAPFSLIPKSLETKENIPLALYDRAITDQSGLDSHICSDRLGYYYDFKDDDISRITGSLGTYAIFGGRGILHDGGFPKAGGHRIAIFIDQRNWLMNLIQKFIKIF